MRGRGGGECRPVQEDRLIFIDIEAKQCFWCVSEPNLLNKPEPRAQQTDRKGVQFEIATSTVFLA
jgi:hypothetical protein